MIEMRGITKTYQMGEVEVHALRGEAQLDPQVASKVLGEFKRLLAEPPPSTKVRPEEEGLVLTPLTEREEEVLQLLVEGLSNKEIAARLYLTEGTVKNHISNVLSKLQANDHTHAVIRALRHGLVEL